LLAVHAASGAATTWVSVVVFAAASALTLAVTALVGWRS
jgi:hypothetical protein